jgi:hypothetical protein
LSLKQLAILMAGWALAYQVFTRLSAKMGTEVALVPTILIVAFTLVIVFFNKGGMTFLPFILSMIRFNVNLKERLYVQWIDSFQPIDIGFVAKDSNNSEKDVDFDSKIDKMKKLENKLEKL